MDLAQAIPDVEVLLRLEPEELGAKLLFLIRTERNGSFNPEEVASRLWNNPDKIAYPLEKKYDVQLALSEAFSWLEAQGLIIRVTLHADNGWRTLSRRALRFEDERQFADYTAARTLPRDLLHMRIKSAAWLSFMRGAYATAAFEAMREVEISVREAAGFEQGDHGVPMIRRAFHKDTGPLTDQHSGDGEREALLALFVGAIGSYKNPHSHRHVPLNDPAEAAEVIVLASHLLRIVDARIARS